MLGTIVWDAYNNKAGTYSNLPPHYKEFDDIVELMDNLTHLQICYITLIIFLLNFKEQFTMQVDMEHKHNVEII